MGWESQIHCELPDWDFTHWLHPYFMGKVNFGLNMLPKFEVLTQFKGKYKF
jgi:hypothetical protein